MTSRLERELHQRAVHPRLVARQSEVTSLVAAEQGQRGMRGAIGHRQRAACVVWPCRERHGRARAKGNRAKINLVAEAEAADRRAEVGQVEECQIPARTD